MINNPELIKQIIDNITKLSKEDLDKVMKKANEWYNKKVTDTNVGNIDKDIKRCKELIKDKHKEWIGMTNQKAIGNVLKKYEELKVLEDDIQDKRIAYIDTLEFEENFIPKKKIKDKIEELKYEKNKRIQLGIFILKDYENQHLLGEISSLEELLEESEDK